AALRRSHRKGRLPLPPHRAQHHRQRAPVHQDCSCGFLLFLKSTTSGASNAALAIPRKVVMPKACTAGVELTASRPKDSSLAMADSRIASIVEAFSSASSMIKSE